MARTHVQTEPGRTACGRDATGVQLEGTPDCRTCLRVAPPPPRTTLETVLDQADHLSRLDAVAVELLRDTLEALERHDLGDTARAQLTGRALQLLDALQLTPAARAARGEEEAEPDPATPTGTLRLVRDRRS